MNTHSLLEMYFYIESKFPLLPKSHPLCKNMPSVFIYKYMYTIEGVSKILVPQNQICIPRRGLVKGNQNLAYFRNGIL